MELDLQDHNVTELKARARARREASPHLTQAQALEAVARANGARDWNTARAMAGRPVRLALSDRVRGTYLGHPFTGRVHALRATDRPDRLHVTVHFDTPVDVVAFDSFSSFRRRVSALITPTGRSLAKTSDGRPHLELHGVTHT